MVFNNMCLIGLYIYVKIFIPTYIHIYHSGPNVNERQRCLFKLLKFISSLLLEFIVIEIDKTVYQMVIIVCKRLILLILLA